MDQPSTNGRAKQQLLHSCAKLLDHANQPPRLQPWSLHRKTCMYHEPKWLTSRAEQHITGKLFTHSLSISALQPCPGSTPLKPVMLLFSNMRTLFFLILLFTLVFRARSALPHSMALPSTTAHRLRLRSGCHRSDLDDFYACNCYFVIMFRRTALVPRSRIHPRLLQGARSSCIKRFGGLKSLKKRCMLIARPPRRYFLKRDALRGMKVLVKRCHFRNK